MMTSIVSFNQMISYCKMGRKSYHPARSINVMFWLGDNIAIVVLTILLHDYTDVILRLDDNIAVKCFVFSTCWMII
jgi:hypothetical protein